MKINYYLKNILKTICYTFSLSMFILTIFYITYKNNFITIKTVLSMFGASISIGFIQLVMEKVTNLYKQSLIHFVLVYTTTLLFAYAGNWFSFSNIYSLISFSIVFVIIYVILWIYFMCTWKRKENLLNKKLKEYKKSNNK